MWFAKACEGGQLNPPIQVLAISHSFPPSPEVGGRRIASFCRYLPDFGIRPVVLTVDKRSLRGQDHSYPAPEGIQVEQAPELRPYSWYGRLKRRFLSTREGQNDSPQLSQPTSPYHRQSSLVRQLACVADMPDPHLGWYPPAVRAGRRVIEHESIDAIFSSAPPWTTHLIARHLKKKYGIPWVADFRDPWADASHRREAPRWFSQLHLRMEASCLRLADLVICNTEVLRKSFVERYPALPASKFVTLTNGFDDIVPPRAEAQGPRRILLHLGDIYGNRRIDTFCQALRNLVDAGEIDPTSLRIMFVGDFDPAVGPLAERLLPDLIGKKCVEFVPRMNWQDGQRALWAADLLLLFQGSFKAQVPAKFYEYLQTGKPILAVAAKGALSDLMDLTGSGLWVDPKDPSDIAAALLRALQLPAVSPEEVQRRWSGQFHFRSLTAQLAGWIREVASRTSQKSRVRSQKSG